MPKTAIKKFSTDYIQLDTQGVSFSQLDVAGWDVCHFTEGHSHDAQNQDFVSVKKPGFIGVADGVGSGSYGDIASWSALEFLSNEKPRTFSEYRDQLVAADGVVSKAIASISKEQGATMVTCAWLESNSLMIGHVGDCRAYKYSPVFENIKLPRLCQLTTDQTYENMKQHYSIDRSPDDPCWMLGTGVYGLPAIEEISIEKGEMILLSSDGLHDFVPAVEIERILDQIRHVSEPKVRDAILTMRDSARKSGSNDDISIVIAWRKHSIASRIKGGLRM